MLALPMCPVANAKASWENGWLGFEEVMLALLMCPQDVCKARGCQLHVRIAGGCEGQTDVGARKGRPRTLAVCDAARQHHHARLCQLQHHRDCCQQLSCTVRQELEATGSCMTPGQVRRTGICRGKKSASLDPGSVLCCRAAPSRPPPLTAIPQRLLSA